MKKITLTNSEVEAIDYAADRFKGWTFILNTKYYHFKNRFTLLLADMAKLSPFEPKLCVSW